MADETHRLCAHVHVRHPGTDEAHAFSPGDQPPPWAAEILAGNPKVWDDWDGPTDEELYVHPERHPSMGGSS